ncbi:MAG: hypothetical protein ABXS93_07465 [Sulfurimonas sp.]
MAGVHFSFDNFEQVVALNIGLADRLDENRAESFTLMYCDFSGVDPLVAEECLADSLRTLDSLVNYANNYYFVLPYTDQYGAVTVREMFEEFFDKDIKSCMVSYPADGENVKELLETLRDEEAKLK